MRATPGAASPRSSDGASRSRTDGCASLPDPPARQREDAAHAALPVPEAGDAVVASREAAAVYEALLPQPGTAPDGLLCASCMPAGDLAMVLIRDVRFAALDARSLLPFWGTVHVAYQPDGLVVPNPKMSQAIRSAARETGTQRALTTAIHDLIDHCLRPKGVAVLVETRRFLPARDDYAGGPSQITTRMSGSFAKGDDRAVFLRLARNRHDTLG